MSYNKQYSNTYLNNSEHDIENNINETRLPELTLYNVTKLDNIYKQYLPHTIKLKYSQHIDNISQLMDYVKIYESLNKNAMKIQFYSQKIKPILENETENLDTVIYLLYDNK